VVEVMATLGDVKVLAGSTHEAVKGILNWIANSVVFHRIWLEANWLISRVEGTSKMLMSGKGVGL
jgi:hypothetical protein